jgi:TctA family transporter
MKPKRRVNMIIKAIVFSLLLSLTALNIQPVNLWADDTSTKSEKAVSAQEQNRVVDFATRGCLIGFVVGFILPGAGNVIGCAVGALVGGNAGTTERTER